MKNKREIYRALADGETIIALDGDTVSFDGNGALVNQDGYSDDWYFNVPEDWSIKKKTVVFEMKRTYYLSSLGTLHYYVSLSSDYQVEVGNTLSCTCCARSTTVKKIIRTTIVDTIEVEE